MTKRKVLIVMVIVLLFLTLTACSEDELEERDVIDFLYADKALGDININGNMLNETLHDYNEIVITNEEKVVSISGYFNKGVLISGEVDINYSNGDSIYTSGDFKELKLNGSGKSEFSIGKYNLVRDGVFEDSKLNGVGFKSFVIGGRVIESAKAIYEDDKIK